MRYEEPKAQIMGAAQMVGIQAERVESPIEKKLRELQSALECAHEGVNLLDIKLTPVRAVCPTGAAGVHKTGDEACEIESRLQYMIDAASYLSTRLSELRAELRI
jgi:hypothetical protein